MLKIFKMCIRDRPLTAAEKAEIDALFNIQHPDPDQLVEDAATALADFTGCVTVSSTMTPEDVTVRRIDILPSGPRTLVVLVIASNGVVKSKVCRVDFAVTPQVLDFFQMCIRDSAHPGGHGPQQKSGRQQRWRRSGTSWWGWWCCGQ